MVEEQGRLWIVTEQLTGTDLAQTVSASGPVPSAEAGPLTPIVQALLAKSPNALPARRWRHPQSPRRP